MSFGRNPHVAKATAAEQKALAASDEAARAQSWREAARQWERAAEREMNDKRRAEYEQNAVKARTTADNPDGEPEPAAETAAPPDRRALN
jgi:hypothetical protein